MIAIKCSEQGKPGGTPPVSGGRSDRPLLTLAQVAARLQVSTKTVRRLIAKNAVPHILVGSQIRIPFEHVHLLTKKRW